MSRVRRARSPLRRCAILALAVLAALAAPAPAGGAPAAGACETVERATPRAGGTGLRRPPLVVGDSSLLQGVDALARLGFEAHARGCRPVSDGVDLLARRRHAGRLPRLVVLALGANGGLTRAEVSRALRILGPRRRLALVTSAGSASAARAARAAGRRHPGRVLVVDWARAGGRHLVGDRIHIGPVGEAAMARLIHRRLRPYMPPPRSLLRVARSTAGVRDCGLVRRGRARVVVLRGPVLCGRARAVARAPAPRTAPGWRPVVWRLAGPPPWTDVHVRRDGRAVVGVRPA